MKNKNLKIFISLALVAIMVLSLVACGQSAVANANGEWGNGGTWEFNSSTKTLTITGSGDIPDASSPDSVSWKAVRASVTKIVFVPKDGSYITSIGDNAFYGMMNLTDISMPDSITSIDNTAFAFCTSLKTISLPKNVKFIGASAFEGCTALESILIQPAIETICERAFAFCKSLKSVTIAGDIASLGHWTFKNCTSLDSLALNQSFTSDRFSSTFAEGSNLYGSEISFVEVFSEKATITTNHLCGDTPIAESEVQYGYWGDAYTCTAESVAGYVLDGDAAITGTVTSKDITVNFKYKTIEEVTSAEAATDSSTDTATEESEGITTSTIVGIVIFGIVIIGICVGAFFLVRSGKKQENASSTVRKYDKNDKSKGNKK